MRDALALLDSDASSKKMPFIYLYGHSLGSGVAVKLAKDFYLNPKEFNEVSTLTDDCSRPQLAGVILDAGFTSIRDASLSHPLASIFRVFPIVQQYM